MAALKDSGAQNPEIKVELQRIAALWCYPKPVDPRTDVDFLFNRADDPALAENVWHAAPERRKAMLSLVKKTMLDEGTPPERFARLGLV